ncbi:MAG: glycosyltransferase family 2 protein [Nitrospiraceae bacterium]
MRQVSVVIPVLNAARTLPDCLAALAQLEPAPLEVLLVDNGSTDDSLARLHAFAARSLPYRIHVLQAATRGASAARNAGIRAAAGEIIAFTDADCEPDSGWLTHLDEPFEDHAVTAVAGQIVAAPASTALELFSALYTLQSPRTMSRHRQWTLGAGGFPTANFSIRRESVIRLGGFDETIRIYGEDFDLCARLYADGGEIVFSPEAKVVHHHRTTFAGMVRQAFGFGRSHPYLLRRHAAPGLWLELPGRVLHVPQWPIRSWVNVVSADKKVLAIVAVGVLLPPLLCLVIPYGAWLMWLAKKRATAEGKAVSIGTAGILAGCLLAKSFAMTIGRCWGSVRYGVVCL